MFTNVKKTFFLHLCDNPDINPIHVDDQTIIGPAENNEYVYLGVKFVASDNIVTHIKKNLQCRMYHVSKFYDWLAINKNTPIRMKLQVFYTCMFNAYLYGIEAWWGIDAFKNQLLLLERKLLKNILGVKRNTPDDLLYLEIDRPDIMAVIKWRQYSFFKRLLSLDEEEAISRKLTSMYSHLPIIRYYEDLDKDVIMKNKVNRLHLSQQATTTYISRYHNLIDRRYSHIIYDNFIPEKIRIIITKWRLSCQLVDVIRTF